MAPVNHIASEVAITLIKEIFKSSFSGLSTAKLWINKKITQADPFGFSAKKYAEHIENKYNNMRIFGMEEPVPLREIYVRLDILKKISANQRLSIDDLKKFAESDQIDFDLNRSESRRDLNKLHDSFDFKKENKPENAISVVNRTSRLLVLGKPGSGKTTLLKYIALKAIDRELSTNKIPIFISIKDWTDSSLTINEFIEKQFDVCDFLEESTVFIEKILKEGNALILLDGLDEASGNTNKTVNELKDFFEKFHKNNFIMSCRNAANEYVFDKFTEVEVSDFDNNQINTFINKWFRNDSKLAKSCWNKLNSEKNKRIKELSKSPLLLILICLAFEETTDFPSNRSELYKEAIDALLKKWDATRGIQRKNPYKKLSLKRKETLLSDVAEKTFELNQYFIHQNIIEKHIANFIENIFGIDLDNLEIESEMVLKSIESQHGLLVERAQDIYSFSHLTIQEFFTAKYIVDNEARGSIERLIDSHFLDIRWNEVILLTSGLLINADNFIIILRDKISFLSSNNIKLFLCEIEKETHNKTSFDKVVILASIIFSYFICFLSDKINIDIDKDLLLNIAIELDDNKELSSLLNKITSLMFRISYFLEKFDYEDSKRISILANEHDHINNSFRNYDRTNFIWLFVNNRIDFLNFYKNKYHNLIHFTSNINSSFLHDLTIYINANNMLFECLNCECDTSLICRSKTIGSLLQESLPIADSPHTASSA